MGDSLKNLNASKHRKSSQFHKSYKAKSASHAKAQGEEAKTRIHHTPAASKLPSNWDKYDRNIDETLEGPHAPGIEFNTTAMLASHNTQFQFQLKQDKVFLPRSDCSLNPIDIFELDLHLIHLSLATIPFYKRIKMDESLFSTNELDVLNLKAQDANATYHTYLATQSSLTETTVKPESASGSEISIPDEVEIHTSDLDMFDGISTSLQSKDLETKELEDWLDNVL